MKKVLKNNEEKKQAAGLFYQIPAAIKCFIILIRDFLLSAIRK